MTCPNCGQAIEDGREFCPACGGFLRLEEGERSGIDTASPTTKPSKVLPHRSSWGARIGYALIVLIAGFILLNFIGVGFAFTEGETHRTGTFLVGLGAVAAVGLAVYTLFGGLDKFDR